MPTIGELVAQAKADVRDVPPAELAERIAAGDALVVDLREPAELDATGIIPGAVSAPRGMLEFFADPTSPYHRPEFDPERPTILYCASGGRSALAALALRQLGYTDVAHVDGGVRAWTEAGHATAPASAG